MGRLAEYLAQPTVTEPAAATQTVFDQDGTYSQSTVLAKQPSNTHELLETFGHDPEAFAVDGSVSVSHRELVDGRMVSTYRYKLVERRQPLDIDELVRAAKKAKPHKGVGTGPHWAVFQAGDQQIGKRAQMGGTESIIECYLASLESFVDEYKAAKRFGIGGIQVSHPGDCLEGSVSQSGRNMGFLTTETITEQTRIYRRLLMETVKTLAPLTDHLCVDVINGNHDQSSRQLNTFPGDGWATECAIAVDDALKLSPEAFGHVEVRVPDKWKGYMTVPVGDTNVALVHGHQFGGSSSATAMRWWERQTFGGQSPAAAQVLQHGHFHTWQLDTTDTRTRIESPSFDAGSDWFTEKYGTGGRRGGLFYLLKAGEVSRMSLI